MSECRHEKSRLGDNYCVVCGTKFDKKFSAQDLVGKFGELERSFYMRMDSLAGGQTDSSQVLYRGWSDALSLYKKWKLDNFGI